MKRLSGLLFIIFSLCFSVSSMAQIKNVHGLVEDEMGELMGASVCEIDASGRIIEATTTDMSGNFSLQIRNPKNRLSRNLVGISINHRESV